MIPKNELDELTGYTPEPWSACGGGTCSCGIISGGENEIATVVHGEWGDSYPAIRVEPGIGGKAEAYIETAIYGKVDKQVGIANSKLIEKAPDMRRHIDEQQKIISFLIERLIWISEYTVNPQFDLKEVVENLQDFAYDSVKDVKTMMIRYSESKEKSDVAL